MKPIRTKVVNQFFKQFTEAKGSKDRTSVKKYAYSHLSLEEFCSFLSKTTDWLIEQIENLNLKK